MVVEYSREDREAICDSFRRLLSDHADETRLRELVETESGFDSQLWQQMAELGLTGIVIGDQYGGSGAGIEEVEALMEVAGDFLLAGPFVESCVIAPSLLAASTDETFAAPLLKSIASGESIVSVAACGKSGDWTLPPEVRATEQADSWSLTGDAHFVSYAHVADHCIVYANTDEGVSAFLVNMYDAGMTATLHTSNDPTQRLSTLRLEAVETTLLSGVDGEARSAALRSALVALAGEQVGGSQRIFELTMEYLKTRHQFGQPIGRFQALKHMAADLLVELESATSAARHAAGVMASAGDEVESLAYLAGFTCADNYRKITADAIQLHGGIAYTKEHSAHLYWRRAQSGQWLYSSSDRLRDLYLTELEKTL